MVKKKRKRSRKASNFDKVVEVLVESNQKREEDKVENRLLRQKRHDEKLNQSQQLIDILRLAFAKPTEPPKVEETMESVSRKKSSKKKYVCLL